MVFCCRAEISSPLALQMFGCAPHVIPAPLFGRLPQRRLPAEPRPLSAPSAAQTWWARRKTLRQTPPEDAMHCAVCTGSVRCLGWSWLAVSKHSFGIYLPETLRCKPLVGASPSAGSRRGPNLDTQKWPEQTLILGRGAFCHGSVHRPEVHIYSISQEQPDDAKGCPTCCCCILWILLLILTCHLDLLSHAGGNLWNDMLC